jgi:hypothetical protein
MWEVKTRNNIAWRNHKPPTIHGETGFGTDLHVLKLLGLV